MFMIVVTCASFVLSCEPSPVSDARYATRAKCERALLTAARDWKPLTGFYRINCERRRR